MNARKEAARKAYVAAIGYDIFEDPAATIEDAEEILAAHTEMETLVQAEIAAYRALGFVVINDDRRSS